MTPPANTERYKNHRFPAEIISHGVWLYYRFTLSDRVVYLQAAGKYQRPAWRSSQGQKGLDERALMASPQPSPLQ